MCSSTYVLRPLPLFADEAAGADTSPEANDSPTEFHTADEPEDFDHWAEVLVCDLDDVQVLKTRGQYCQIKFGRGSEAEIRNVRFASVGKGAFMICLRTYSMERIHSHMTIS